MHRLLLVLVGSTILLPAIVAAQDAEDPLAWIDRDRLRTAYFYANPPAEEKVQQLVDAGMNAMILKATPDKALPFLQEAKKHEGMHTFLAVNFSINAEQEGLRQAVLADGRVERYACPLEERFWEDHLLKGMLERAELGQRAVCPCGAVGLSRTASGGVWVGGAAPLGRRISPER